MQQSNQMTLQKGFADPVDGAGQTFRAILDVLSRPGTVAEISGPAETPHGLSKTAAAVLLTMADYATPVWMDGTTTNDAITSYIRFHTNAPITARADQSAFALFNGTMSDFFVDVFHPGTPQYPDRSTTLIIDVADFDSGPTVQLTGPGIDIGTTFQVNGLAHNFWSEMQKNNALFPLGVDVIFTAPDQLAALPRSTRIEVI